MAETTLLPTAAPPAGSPQQRRRRTMSSRRNRVGALYAAPMALIVVVFFVIPLILMVWMSVNHWPLLGASRPNGVQNYKVLDDSTFIAAIWFTLKYTVVTTVVLSAVAFGLALLVQDRRPGVGFFRTTFFLPAAVGLASASLLFYSFFNTADSPLNAGMRWLGVDNVNWLGSQNASLASVIGVVTWRFAGFYMLILMTGLHSIDPMLYEAARTDGATRWQLMRHITLPLLRPAVALMMVLSVTGSLLAFDQFFILTGGRQGTATVVITVYRQAFIRQDLGGAAAMSVVILVALLVLNGGQLAVLRRGQG